MKKFQYKRRLRIFYFLLCGVNIGFLISVIADNSALYNLSFTAAFGDAENAPKQTVVISRYLTSYKYNSDKSNGVTNAGYGRVTHGTKELTDLDADIDCDKGGHLSEPIDFSHSAEDCSDEHACAHCRGFKTAASCEANEAGCVWNVLTCNAAGVSTCTAEINNDKCWPCSSANDQTDCAAVGGARGHKCVWAANATGGTCTDGDIADDWNYCDQQIRYIEIYAWVTIAFSVCLMALVITQECYDEKADEVEGAMEMPGKGAMGIPVMLMILTQALHGAALALGLAFYVSLDESSDSYMLTNFGAMGTDRTRDEEDASDGTYFLAFVYFSIVFLTVCHAIHIVNLYKQRGENWLGWHQLYANFM